MVTVITAKPNPAANSQQIRHFDIVSYLSDGSENSDRKMNDGPIDPLLRESLSDIIVNNEMLQARDTAKKTFATCGDIYYITQADIDKIKEMRERRKKFSHKMFVQGCVWMAVSMVFCYVAGKIIGQEEAFDYVKANYDIKPRQ